MRALRKIPNPLPIIVEKGIYGILITLDHSFNNQWYKNKKLIVREETLDHSVNRHKG